MEECLGAWQREGGGGTLPQSEPAEVLSELTHLDGPCPIQFEYRISSLKPIFSTTASNSSTASNTSRASISSSIASISSSTASVSPSRTLQTLDESQSYPSVVTSGRYKLTYLPSLTSTALNTLQPCSITLESSTHAGTIFNLLKPSALLSQPDQKPEHLTASFEEKLKTRQQNGLPSFQVKSVDVSSPHCAGQILKTVEGKVLHYYPLAKGCPLASQSCADSGAATAATTSQQQGQMQYKSERGSPSSTTQTPLQLKEEDSPQRLCLVCGDTASGFHYGVSSCEACKAFFKRTIQGNIEYSCPASRDCEINKRRRKACQACRFEKCLQKGMLKEGVRLDRVRGGRQKYRRVTEYTGYGDVEMARRVSLEENQILESLSAAEPEPLSIIGCEVSGYSANLRPTVLLADIYDRELVVTIGWAKQVPGFSDLSLNDQMKLLQSSWTEVLTLSLAYRSLPKLGKLNFACDFSLLEADATAAGLASYFRKVMCVVERFERIGFSREEYLILKSLVLCNSDCAELDDPAVVEGLRASLLSSLQDCVYAVRCGDVSTSVQQLLLVLPALREAGQLLRTFWNYVKKNGVVQLNRLLLEMLEA